MQKNFFKRLENFNESKIGLFESKINSSFQEREIVSLLSLFF